jgi:hypothetical protein
MKHLVWIAAAFASAAVLATPAMANAPNGNGHVITIGIPCDGAEPQLIRLTRNLGKSAWVELTGQHYVVGAFAVTTTFTPDGGSPIVVESFSNTFGNKVGLGQPIVCEGSFSEPVPGGTLAGTIRGETYYLPPGN